MGTNVGVGTTSPQYPLDIMGNTRILGNSYLMGTNVGVGTTNPQYLMDINGGNLRISSSLISQSAYNLPVTSSVSPITYININSSAYAYMVFTQSGTITFPTNTQIGYLIVGGGGGGGGYGNSSGIGYGGPGTAGNIILQPLSTSTTSLNGAIQINIGSGGVQSSNPSSGNNGANTTITQGATIIKTTSNGQNNYGIGGIYTSGSIGSASSNTNNNIATLNDINQSSSTTNGYGGAGGYLTNGTITSYSFYTTTSTPNSTSFTGNIAISSGSLTLSSSFPGGELAVGQLINNNCVILNVTSSTTATVYPTNINLTISNNISVSNGASTFTANITFGGTKSLPTMTVITANPIYPIIVNQTFTYSGTTFTITSITSSPPLYFVVYSLSANHPLNATLSDSNKNVTITRTQPTFTKYTYNFYNANPGNAGSNGFALIYYQLTNYNRQTSIGLDTYIASNPASSIVAIDNGFGSNDVIVNTTNPATYNATYNPVSQERLRITASGYVGIGTNSPQYPLDIYGSTHIDDNLQIEGVLTVNNDSTIYGNTNIGSLLNVIGATTLSSTLGVTGATTLSSTLGVTGVATLSSVVVTGTATIGTTLGVTGATTLSSTLGVTGATTLSSTLGVTDATTLSSTLNVAGNTFLMKYVGIGKTNPSYDLDVSGTIYTSKDININGLTVGKGGNTVANNTAFGYQALNVNTSGYHITAIGYQAALANTTAQDGVFIGYQAGYKNTTGYQNTVVGAAAGLDNTTGNLNTCIGYQAGQSNTTGSNNTFLGYLSKNPNNFSSSTAIGYNSQLTASNQIMLGTATETVVCPGTTIISNSNSVGLLSNFMYGWQHTGQLLVTIPPSNNIINPSRSGSANITDACKLTIALSTDGFGILQVNQSGTGYNPLMLNPAGGSVGINMTTNPASALHVNGVTTSTSYNATSDYRIKENVEPLDSHFTVDNLRPVQYDNTSSKQHAIGFIAHEVQEHYPFLVDGEKDGDKTQSLNYNGLIGILVNEIQLLKKTVQEMKTKIDSLEKSV